MRRKRKPAHVVDGIVHKTSPQAARLAKRAVASAEGLLRWFVLWREDPANDWALDLEHEHGFPNKPEAEEYAQVVFDRLHRGLTGRAALRRRRQEAPRHRARDVDSGVFILQGRAAEVQTERKTRVVIV